ncbi:MAG: hypothetical protein LBQ61_00605 [Spirochaetales bacterium]|jgi:endogenous inhibitor of DNA gyrase (YacG/DUF329 family)|nr:hypothetical protein [Spirochaetales bacterium]
MTNEETYIRCQTCGNYRSARESLSPFCCSRECALSYQRCPVCGGYFERGSGEGDFCSPQCAAPPSRELLSRFRWAAEGDKV